MLNTEYEVEVGIEGWREMRALAAELGHKSGADAHQDELVRFVCSCDALIAGVGVENLLATTVKSKEGYLLTVSATVADPDLLAKTAIKRYVATWPAVREPDPWEPASTAEALYTLVTNLTPAIDSEYSECYWIGMPKFSADQQLEKEHQPTP